MPKETISISELNNVVKETIKSLENGKIQMFEISEQALNEYKNLDKKLQLIQESVKETIDETETLEKIEKECRKELMLVSKNFHVYSENDIKKAYEKVKNIQVKLALKREQERQLISHRAELERQIRNMKDIVERSEYLASHVGVAMNYLTGSLYNISDTIEDLQKKELLGVKVIMAQEEERQRISRDIHDGPAQSLTNIVIKCEVCEKLFDIDSERTKKEVSELKGLARDSLKEIREIIFDLRPMSLDDLGLVPTLEQYTAKFTRDNEIEVVLNSYNRGLEIDPVIEVAVFRIIQEALNNIKKHSQANRCIINLAIEENFLIAQIIDNGIGFNIQDIKDSKYPSEYDSGFGIANMKQRAELLKGILTIQSKQGRGTAIALKVPLFDNNEFTEEEYDGRDKGYDC